MDDEIEDIDLSENDEVVEDLDQEIDQALDEVETHDASDEDTTDWKAKALKQEAINKRLAKKLNEKPPAPKEQTQSTNSDTLSREEVYLIAQGMTPENLDELKDIAKAKGLPLLKAKETPIFTSYLAAQEVAEKKEKAKLGSSRGSATTQQEEIGNLSREDHQEKFKEIMSKVQ